MARRNTIRQVWLDADFSQRLDGSNYDWKSLDIHPELLKTILQSSYLGKVSVNAGIFGLVKIDRDMVLRQLNDKYFENRLHNLVERKNGKAVASITMRHDTYSKQKYDIAIHWIGCRSEDGEYVYQLD